MPVICREHKNTSSALERAFNIYPAFIFGWLWLGHYMELSSLSYTGWASQIQKSKIWSAPKSFFECRHDVQSLSDFRYLTVRYSKMWILKPFWSQAFWIRDTQPVFQSASTTNWEIIPKYFYLALDSKFSRTINSHGEEEGRWFSTVGAEEGDLGDHALIIELIDQIKWLGLISIQLTLPLGMTLV